MATRSNVYRKRRVDKEDVRTEGTVDAVPGVVARVQRQQPNADSSPSGNMK